jgi:tRNA nucleotidyltransferase/poly(A) polymerase
MGDFYKKNYEDFSLLIQLHRKYLIGKPYLVGGAVRDYCSGSPLDDIRDFDITTMSNDCVRLSILFASIKNKTFKMFKDKHVSILDELKNYDFSSNVVYSNVSDHLERNYPEKINFKESFSRDFTINSMHQDFFSEKVYDPTGLGLKDISNKIIRTPCPARISLGNDKRRIFRAIHLAVKMGFSIHGDIIDYSKNIYSREGEDDADDFSKSSEINKAMMIDSEATFFYIKEMGLYKQIPLVGPYKEYIIRNGLLLDYMS